MVLPLRSSAVLIGESRSTASTTEYGASAMAAMAISGAPLATKASSGPEPMPMSMAEFKTFFEQDVATNIEIVKAADIKIQ